MDKNLIGLAGEFYVLAQLAQRGFVGTLTLGHTKGVDILVSDSHFKKLYRVEVKTTRKKPHYERLFGASKFYSWPMSLKHESLRDNQLFYCFVHLGLIGELPKFFIVPSRKVATYVRWEHKRWRASRESEVQVTSMRTFRIPISDPDQYHKNWKAFGKTSNKPL